jgi:hypothetical protein
MQLDHHYRSEILASLLEDFSSADRRFLFPAWEVSCRADLSACDAGFGAYLTTVLIPAHRYSYPFIFFLVWFS